MDFGMRQGGNLTRRTATACSRTLRWNQCKWQNLWLFVASQDQGKLAPSQKQDNKRTSCVRNERWQKDWESCLWCGCCLPLQEDGESSWFGTAGMFASVWHWSLSAALLSWHSWPLDSYLGVEVENSDLKTHHSKQLAQFWYANLSCLIICIKILRHIFKIKKWIHLKISFGMQIKLE